MEEEGSFWRLAHDLVGEHEDDTPSVDTSGGEQDAEQSPQVKASAQRVEIGSPGLLVAVVLIAVLLLSSLIGVLIWNYSGFDPNDVDGDGIANGLDNCYEGLSEWTSTETLDHDADGCQDVEEDDDDDNDTVPDSVDLCPLGFIDWRPDPASDHDADGCHDEREDNDDDNDNVSDELDVFPLDGSEWQDTDSDGVGDNRDAFPEDPAEQIDTDGDGWGDNTDVFPWDGAEWSDADGDGLGDNTDPDDDNDGALDENDLHLGKDVGVLIRFERFTLYDAVDWFSDQGDMYFCYSIYNQSDICSQGNGALTVTVGEPEIIGLNVSFNLDESLRYHWIELSAYDRDPLVDDDVDIHPDEGVVTYSVVYDSLAAEQNLSFIANGSGDGDAGSLEFSLEPLDYLGMTWFEYSWRFGGVMQSIQIDTTYADYLMYRNMNHAIDWSNAYSNQDIIPQYASFATPNDATVNATANQLRSDAIAQGYTSDIDILRYVYAFVGQIQYAYDIDTTNYSEYPKYPLEMLYDQSGDCEDSSALFISLVESLGYDAALMLGSVKATEDDEWGGHAWPVVALDNHDGWSINGVGAKANLTYYFVESTAYADGSSDIGENPWYEIADEAFYDVEA
ncbi:MAG: transglutaminase-like domain-containing protein [Candidatus Poseidonia sp.]|nr:transglutaminase-like domain-containing protein [Poseidonia sp.]